MNVTLITGASGGIGAALSRKLAKKKHNLLLVARNAGKLKKQCKQLSDEFGINTHFIAADLAKSETAERIFQETKMRGLVIEMLVNNAGIGSGGEFLKLNLKSELDMIQLNISSLVSLTHLFLPQMQRSKNGTIINVSSIVSFLPLPYMTTYAATKAFVRHFTEALTQECKPYNIHVMLLCPGLTKTNFNKAAGIENKIFRGLGFNYNNHFTQTPEQVAGEAMKGLDSGKHVLISGKMNRLAVNFSSLLFNAFMAKKFANAYRKKLDNK